jgi:DNA-binding PadR family transcriptional regulator
MNIKNNTSSRRSTLKKSDVPAHQDAVFGSAIFRGPVKTKTILPLLTLHLLAEGPEHGYGLMERIAEMTGDIMPVNSNTMYPLLRRLEERGFIVGEWEHPDRRSRRTYRITPTGIARYQQIKERMKPHLDRLIVAVRRLYSAMFAVQGGRGRPRSSQGRTAGRSAKSELVS